MVRMMPAITAAARMMFAGILRVMGGAMYPPMKQPMHSMMAAGQEDKAYFGLRSEALLHPGQSNAGQGNETIAEIRWTEEDLRHWLKDHDWPDNNENMDAMRDMISARELQDRSIEEGWEIIDAMVDDGRLARKDEGEKAETSETYDPANPADPLSIADPSASAAATR